jgi:hypothetical protein
VKLSETMIRVVEDTTGCSVKRPLVVFVAEHGVKDAAGRMRRFGSPASARAAALKFIATHNAKEP